MYTHNVYIYIYIHIHTAQPAPTQPPQPKLYLKNSTSQPYTHISTQTPPQKFKPPGNAKPQLSTSIPIKYYTSLCNILRHPPGRAVHISGRTRMLLATFARDPGTDCWVVAPCSSAQQLAACCPIFQVPMSLTAGTGSETLVKA